MGRRRFDRAFKLEAVKLVRERGVSAVQAARVLDVHENVLRKWVKEFAADPQHAFPGQGRSLLLFPGGHSHKSAPAGRAKRGMITATFFEQATLLIRAYIHT